MIVKLLTKHHLESLSFKGGCAGPPESTHVKMPHCWKSHATALIILQLFQLHDFSYDDGLHEKTDIGSA